MGVGGPRGSSTPRQNIAAECERVGRPAFVTGCIAMLEGRHVDPALVVALGTRSVPGGFVAASALGVIHAAFSLYWAAGGTLLVWSLGSDLVESFRGREWLLAPIGAVKLIAAVGPLVLARSGWPAGRVTRSACWLGALLLTIWGGLNTAVGNVVLAGVIRPESGFDQPGMIGHAYLWDPLFLAWGAALAIGLIASRGRATHAR